MDRNRMTLAKLAPRGHSVNSIKLAHCSQQTPDPIRGREFVIVEKTGLEEIGTCTFLIPLRSLFQAIVFSFEHCTSKYMSQSR